jgi:hypothetical protein
MGISTGIEICMWASPMIFDSQEDATLSSDGEIGLEIGTVA